MAPITGAIFAILLYLMFTAGILTGTFFPTIFTPEENYLNSSSLTVVDKSQEYAATDNNLIVQKNDIDSTSKSEPTSVTKQVTTRPSPKQGLNVLDFLARSGPGSGKDYALLIIWCFIAGFAERLVPDALDRLILKNNSVNSGRS